MGVIHDRRQGVAQTSRVRRIAKREEIDALLVRAFSFAEREEPAVLFAEHVLVFGFHAVHGDKRMLTGVFSVSKENFVYIMLVGE